MLRRVASTGLNEVTFYGHAKGVKHEPSVPPTVRRWAEVSYRAALDDWPAVRAQMERFALTGSFRMFGRFRSHRSAGDWHYSGTYFWLRHARVFRKDCFTVPRFYGGVEAWPGIHFTRAEAGCLLFDDLRQLAYEERFWQSRQDEIARWEAERSPTVPPPDLVKPPAFDGFEWPSLEHHPEEFAWLLRRLAEVLPRKILTIGAMHGGVEWHLARRFRNLGREIAITIVERAPAPELFSSIEDARSRFGQQIQLVEGDSTAPDTRARLSERFRFRFVASSPNDRSPQYRGLRLACPSSLLRLETLDGVAATLFHRGVHHRRLGWYRYRMPCQRGILSDKGQFCSLCRKLLGRLTRFEIQEGSHLKIPGCISARSRGV
jgi:hypothetical protein